jgi:hypothetical protein
METMTEMYERMCDRPCELPDTTRAMRQLLDEFPEATVSDWHFAFVILQPGDPHGWPAEEKETASIRRDH